MIQISAEAELFLQRVCNAKTAAERMEKELNDLRSLWFNLSSIHWNVPQAKDEVKNATRKRASEIEEMAQKITVAYLDIIALPWRFSTLINELTEREAELLRRHYLAGMTWEKAFDGLCSDRNGRRHKVGLRDKALAHFDEIFQAQKNK